VDESAVQTRPVPNFEPALELNRGFYDEAVAPLLEALPHAAARLGFGSELLGFDTERSTDHGWGPQLQVFVDASLVAQSAALIDAGLPETFRGWPVRYGWDAVAVKHHVQVSTLETWLTAKLGFNPAAGIDTTDWLITPQQKLLEVTRGAVYRDDTGELTAVRAALAWYPHDIWQWLIACQWRRVAQEEAFVGRTAEVGDELGSAVVAARLARDLMRLWFLFTRQYAPYSKWLGSAFAQLPDSAPLGAALRDAIAARDYPSREDALVTAYEIVAAKHNALGITAPVDPSVRTFYGRPFRVLMADRFVDACTSSLTHLPPVGAIDQFADSTDVLSYTEHARRLQPLFVHD
jgi:hypothetical protein